MPARLRALVTALVAVLVAVLVVPLGPQAVAAPDPATGGATERSTGMRVSATAVPGGSTPEMQLDIFGAREGLSEFVAPTGTRIVSARMWQGGFEHRFIISEDRRTAASVNPGVTGSGALIPMLALEVDLGATVATVLDDGVFTLRSATTGEALETVGISVGVAGRPIITEHPVIDAPVVEGQTVTLGAAATAIPAATMQWQLSTDGGEVFSYVPGGTTLPLVVGPVTSDMDGWMYRVRFTNSIGSTWSDAVTLQVLPTRPVVTEHPTLEPVFAGQSVTLAGAYGGTSFPTTVQWQFSTDGGQVFNYVPGGATTVPWVVGPVTLDMDGWMYRVRFTNDAGSAWSDAATLRVRQPGFLEHPVDAEVVEARTARFTAGVVPPEDGVLGWEVSSDDGASWEAAAAEGAVTQWTSETRWLDLGADGSLTAEADGLLVRAYLRYPDDRTEVSDAARLTVVPTRPVVTEHPTLEPVFAGQSVTLAGAYGGTSFPTTVQWQFSTDGGEVFNYVPGGATTIPWVVGPVTLDMDGWMYRVRFTNDAGSAWSDPATLRVRQVPPDARLEVTPRANAVDVLPG